MRQEHRYSATIRSCLDVCSMHTVQNISSILPWRQKMLVGPVELTSVTSLDARLFTVC